MKRIKNQTIAMLLAALMLLAMMTGCKAAAPATQAAPAAEAAPATETAPATEAAPAEQSFTVGLVQLVEHAALDAAREGFVKALADNGLTEGANLTIDIQNAQGDQSTLSTIGDQFLSENCDLICAIATPAAQAMAGKTTEIPILATAVTDFEVAKLVESNEVPGGNVSGTSDMNPIADQIALLFELFPDVQTVGCIFNSGEDNSVLQAGMAKAEVEKLGKAFTEITVTSTNDVQQAVQTLVTKCDAIYIPTDNTIASAMPIVADAANGAKIPTVCGESNMVVAGGLATLGVNYFDLGYQTGEQAVRILLEGAEIKTMPVEFATGFDAAINGDTAKAIGFTVPEKYADAIVEG